MHILLTLVVMVAPSQSFPTKEAFSGVFGPLKRDSYLCGAERFLYLTTQIVLRGLLVVSSLSAFTESEISLPNTIY